MKLDKITLFDVKIDVLQRMDRAVIGLEMSGDRSFAEIDGVGHGVQRLKLRWPECRCVRPARRGQLLPLDSACSGAIGVAFDEFAVAFAGVRPRRPSRHLPRDSV